MPIEDENSEIMGDSSLGNQSANSNIDGDYPSFDQDGLDTGAPVPLSDVPQNNNQTPNTQQVGSDTNPSGMFSGDQGRGPMKITEEALESMKAQEQAEQEAALASQSAAPQLTEEPIQTDSSFNFEENEGIQDENPMNEQNTLGTYSFGEERVKIKRYNTGFVLSVLGIIIFGGLAYIAYMFYEYLAYKSLPKIPTEKEKTVTMVSNKYDDYGQKLGLFDLEKYKVIYLEKDLDKVDDLLRDADLNFNQKKDDLQRSLNRFGSEIISLKNETKVLREKMNKEGFFPQELVGILDADNAINSIQRSLISLEVVKFSSAIRVFSLMDDIVKELADNFDFTKTNIRERMDTLIDRGEQDVEYYLNVCYNNPYEPEECNNINDFDKYYKTIKEEEDFDTVFFKKLMKYINNQIEYNDMPSFSITFNSFDGKSNSITFSVEVNTTIEDETALFQQGIKNPHIFIISELIKLLKQSTFIVGKSIDARNIKVAPKVVTVAGRQFNVQNSINTFTLPIQKTTEREIFDFIETFSALQESGYEELYDEYGNLINGLSGLDMSGFNMALDTSGYDNSGDNITGINQQGYDEWAIFTTTTGTMSNSGTMTGGIEYTGEITDGADQTNEGLEVEVVYGGEINEETGGFIADEEMSE